MGAVAVLILNQAWLAVVGQERRANLALAAFNANIGLLVLARLLQHVHGDPRAADLGARMLVVSVFLLVPLGLIAARSVARLPWSGSAYAAVLLSFLACALPFAGSWIISDITVGTDALGSTYHAAELGPLAWVLLPYGVISVVAIRRTLARGPRFETELRRGLGLVALFLVAALIHDIAETNGYFRSLLVVDFVAVGLAVVFGYSQARRSARLDVTRLLFDALPDAVLVWRGDRFLFVNPAAEAYLGYTAEELAGRPVLDVTPQELREGTSDWLAAVQASSDPVPPVEASFVRKDGTIVLAEVAGLMLELSGRAAGVAIARDVTEKKQMRAQLLQADRLSSVGTLAAGVAHEINNPLTFVFGHLDLVYEWLGNSNLPSAQLDELRLSLDRMEEGLDRVRTIVRDLKTFSASDAKGVGAVALPTVIEQAIGLVRHQFKYRARLVVEHGDTPPVRGSEARLGQVFLNLLLNAAQAIPEGAPDEMEIRVVTRLGSDGMVVAEVYDTGAGIAPGDLTRIFDPFFTTKAAAGTGLGLPISHGIVTALGGEISVTTELGKGSCFRVTLPAATEPVEERPKTRRRRDSTQPLALRILVIDDEPDVCASIEHMLSGHVVTTACDGGEALALCERLDFDVLLCDVMMPGIDGIAFFEKLRARRPKLADKTIFLSGGALSQGARALLAELPNPLLEKPFDRGSIRAMVRKAAGPPPASTGRR